MRQIINWYWLNTAVIYCKEELIILLCIFIKDLGLRRFENERGESIMERNSTGQRQEVCLHIQIVWTSFNHDHKKLFFHNFPYRRISINIYTTIFTHDNELKRTSVLPYPGVHRLKHFSCLLIFHSFVFKCVINMQITLSRRLLICAFTDFGYSESLLTS